MLHNIIVTLHYRTTKLKLLWFLNVTTWSKIVWKDLLSIPVKLYVTQAELMSGFIEFCVELKSVSEEGGAAAADTDGEASLSQQASGKDLSNKNGRGGRRGLLRRQSSVVCSRVHSLNTISYVENGESSPHSSHKKICRIIYRWEHIVCHN